METFLIKPNIEIYEKDFIKEIVKVSPVFYVMYKFSNKNI
jgi:hypothetical protein